MCERQVLDVIAPEQAFGPTSRKQKAFLAAHANQVVEDEEGVHTRLQMCAQYCDGHAATMPRMESLSTSVERWRHACVQAKKKARTDGELGEKTAVLKTADLSQQGYAGIEGAN